MQANGSTSQRSELLKTQDNLDLREFWKTLMRRKGLVLGILLTTILLTLLFTFLSTPVYRATATVQIEREAGAKLAETDVLGPGDIRDPRGYFDTQLELISSRSLIAQVIKDLKLDETAISPSLLGQVKALFRNNTDAETNLIDSLLDNITVEPIRNSRLVDVHVETPNAELSAKIANALVDNFVANNQSKRSLLTTETTEALEKKIADAKTKLQDSERQLNEYSRKNGILGADDGVETQSTTLSLIVTKLSEQIVQAENDRIKVETADKSSRGEIEAARKRVNLLREELSVRQGELLEQQSKMIEYKTLQREVRNNQEVFQSLLKRIEDIDLAGSMTANNVWAVNKADVPTTRYKPKLSTNLAFATLLGLLLGVAAAFLKEFMYDGIKNVADLEQATGLPILAAIPAAKHNASAHKIARLVVSDPKSSIAEAFRSLRTTLRFSTVESQQSSHVIYVTSACANEGKTTTASNLALAYANAGVKTLLVDADLRNPSFGEALSANAKIGLADYLQGKVESDHLLHKAQADNLYIMTAGDPPKDPVELLSSRRLKQFLDQARRNFEVIILDGPPVLGLADSLLLSSLADSTLLTVNSRDTKVAAVHNAIKRLRQANSNLVGIVLNKVDTSGRLGYDYDYYYYKNEKATA
ncbi:MAG: polysaccharide biosynthesis tyrosine autokinase [Thiofilum sp.]|uniref:polysaccharide biosynthesis tyrosine autokinase n=1 Tax=Thiofilum sp. TaxID=2212733 RepID=UPI0025D84986|nr:polysaccharide biosynthesis tyrosine autokinase [Thiofilum sp.]MBK8453330.1 polysaccharide biosynthesis tyrosine autokinase [Thiofilum sp.]